MEFHFLEVDRQGKIYIPSSVVSKLGLKPGDKLIAIVYHDHVELGPIDLEALENLCPWKKQYIAAESKKESSFDVGKYVEISTMSGAETAIIKAEYMDIKEKDPETYRKLVEELRKRGFKQIGEMSWRKT